MKKRERVIRTLNFSKPDRIPRDLWALPAVDMFQEEEKHCLLRKYPLDITRPSQDFGGSDIQKRTDIPSKKEIIKRGPKKGERYVDRWGSIRNVGEDGVMGEVKSPIIDDKSKLKDVRPPWEILNNLDIDKVNEECKTSDKFVISSCVARPFERFQFLRGSENALKDLISDIDFVKKLLTKIHEFNLERIDLWLQTDVDGLLLMDDWGAENNMLVSPSLWRDLFKPMYREYFAKIHDENKYVFFHSDGWIEEIIGDLIEIGVDALNSQLFVMDIEKIAEKFRGKVTFWGEIDRRLLYSGSEEDIEEAVKRVFDALYKAKGGVIAQCEWGKSTPVNNIAKVFKTWDSLSNST